MIDEFSFCTLSTKQISKSVAIRNPEFNEEIHNLMEMKLQQNTQSMIETINEEIR